MASFFAGVAPHELAHGTVFRTKRLNGVFLYLYSLLSWWDPFDYGTSHTYHHRYTLYPEGDRENLLPLHPSVGRTFLLQMFTINLLTRPGRNFTKGGLLSTLAITVLSSLGLVGSTGRRSGSGSRHCMSTSRPRRGSRCGGRARSSCSMAPWSWSASPPGCGYCRW